MALDVLQILYNAMCFVVIVSLLAFIHEFGHYYIAKLSGVRVDTFAIGLGPEILGRNDKSGTRWKFCLFPLGGYVRMFGDADASSRQDVDKLSELSEADTKLTFYHKSLPIKSAIVAAGPIANFIFTILVMFGLFYSQGKSYALPIIDTLLEGQAAEQAGLKTGDIITTINNNHIEEFDDIRRIVSLNIGDPLNFTVQRNGQELHFKVQPKIINSKDAFGNEIKIGAIGITSSSMAYNKLSLGESIYESLKQTWHISTMTLKATWEIIRLKRGSEEISGAIRIAKYSGQSVQHGFSSTVWFMAILSLNLGLINLFPIPVLDGGHLMFYAVEAVFGKKLSERLQIYGFKIGFALIITLALFSLFNDLKYVKII